jgi:XTP/dITP diphosphohydrolase
LKLIFATQNKHKVEEIQAQISTEFQVKSLLDINYLEELEETQETLQGNALQKVRFVHQEFQLNAFADDTGLEVESLNGEPGVYSARYAGESKSFVSNMDKLLENLAGKPNRRAQFRTVIALILNDKEYLFEGICKGVITESKSGEKGFGYDPIFKPDGYSKTFAEMELADKAKISHRGIAVAKLISFLNQV